MHVLIALFALLACASAFSAGRVTRASSRLLAMKKDSSPMKFALPAALIPFVAPLATIAAEGTGRAFGVDDGRLVAAALLPSLIIFPLYLQWSSQQENDDFFDGYEKRRNG